MDLPSVVLDVPAERPLGGFRLWRVLPDGLYGDYMVQPLPSVEPRAACLLADDAFGVIVARRTPRRTLTAAAASRPSGGSTTCCYRPNP